MKTVAILYGLNEGRLISKNFIKQCERGGFTVINNPSDANIIFAHSGGCLLVPPDNSADLIIMIGLPFWPGRPLFSSIARKLWLECIAAVSKQRILSWFRKLATQLIYSFDLHATYRMAANRSFARPWNNNQHQVMVRNRYDTFCTPNMQNLPFHGPRSFVSMAGGHDDCWENPLPYIELLQSNL
jgi:hypothetical protein